MLELPGIFFYDRGLGSSECRHDRLQPAYAVDATPSRSMQFRTEHHAIWFRPRPLSRHEYRVRNVLLSTQFLKRRGCMGLACARRSVDDKRCAFNVVLRLHERRCHFPLEPAPKTGRTRHFYQFGCVCIFHFLVETVL